MYFSKKRLFSRRLIALFLCRNESDLIDILFPNRIYCRNNAPLIDIDAALDINNTLFRCLAFHSPLYDVSELRQRILLLPDVEVVVIGNRNDHRSVLCNILIWVRGNHFARKVDRNTLLGERRDDHEDDQQPQHDVHHRRYVNFRVVFIGPADLHTHSKTPITNASSKLSAQAFSTLTDEIIDKLRRGVRHFDAKARYLVREIVEQPHRGHCHQNSECRADQCLGDRAADGPDTGVLIGLQGLKRTDDADDGPEKADERSGRADGRQSSQATLKLRSLYRDGTLESTLGGLHFISGNIMRSLMSGKLFQSRRNDHREM